MQAVEACRVLIQNPQHPDWHHGFNLMQGMAFKDSQRDTKIFTLGDGRLLVSAARLMAMRDRDQIYHTVNALAKHPVAGYALLEFIDELLDQDRLDRLDQRRIPVPDARWLALNTAAEVGEARVVEIPDQLYERLIEKAEASDEPNLQRKQGELELAQMFREILAGRSSGKDSISDVE